MNSRFIGLCVLLLALTLPASARDRAGANVGNMLLRGGVGARPAALGGAYSAVADGPLSLRYNPAGLFEEDRYKLFAQYDASFLDIGRSDAIFSRPFAAGGIAVGLSYVDYGSITRTTTANKVGAGTFNASDLLLSAAYGRSITDRLAFGATVGYYRLSLDATSAGGLAADLGLLYRSRINGLKFAATLRNIGTRAQFFSEQEELPIALSLGGAYQPTERLLVSLDYELVRSQEGGVRAGVEYKPLEMLALRAGYDGFNDVGSGLSLGLGLNWAERGLGFDYAYVPFGDLGNSHRISAEWSFGVTGPRRPRVIAEDEPAPTRDKPVKRKKPTGKKPAKAKPAALESADAETLLEPAPAIRVEPADPSAAIEVAKPDDAVGKTKSEEVLLEPPPAIRVETVDAPAKIAPAAEASKPKRATKKSKRERREVVTDEAVTSPSEQEQTRARKLSADMCATAKILVKNGEIDAALSHYLTAQSLDPENLDASYNIAALYFLKKNYDRARICFESHLAMRPDDPDALMCAGYSKWKLGEGKAALKDLNRAVNIAPDRADIRKLRDSIRRSVIGTK